MPKAIVEAQMARAWYAERSVSAAAAFVSALDAAVANVVEVSERWPVYLYG